MVQKTGFIPSFMEIDFAETFTKFHCHKLRKRDLIASTESNGYT